MSRPRCNKRHQPRPFFLSIDETHHLNKKVPKKDTVINKTRPPHLLYLPQGPRTRPRVCTVRDRTPNAQGHQIHLQTATTSHFRPPSTSPLRICTNKIDFSDVDGGPWKQGWLVSYKGDEWDSEKLKVIVVPYSHNDPGRKLTVEEYYDMQSRHILDTIVDTLSKDSRQAKFGTLEDYFWTLREEAERINHLLPGNMTIGVAITFPGHSSRLLIEFSSRQFVPHI